jgi:SAM-dependent methyltransferase
MRDTDRDWSEVARNNPYWGVLSVDRFKGRSLGDDDLNAFFQSGAAHVAETLRLVRQHLDPRFEIDRALDFGCGVGRLAIALCAHAREVVGVDVAPDMLRLCAERAGAVGAANLKLVEGDDALSRVEGVFDFVNSYIVLQHIPPARGLGLIARLLAATASGGVASLQMTYGKAQKFLKHEEASIAYYRRDGDEITSLCAQGDCRPEGSITMYDYDLNKVMALVQSVSKSPILFRPTDDDGHIGAHLLLRKD